MFIIESDGFQYEVIIQWLQVSNLIYSKEHEILYIMQSILFTQCNVKPTELFYLDKNV